MTGSLPEEFDQLTQLTAMGVNENYLTGSIPLLPSRLAGCALGTFTWEEDYLPNLVANTNIRIIAHPKRMKILTGFITQPEKPKEIVLQILQMHLVFATSAPISVGWKRHCPDLLLLMETRD